MHDLDEKLAKQALVLQDFEQNNKKYKEYLGLEVESNRYLKECFRNYEEQFLKNTKQIEHLNKKIEEVELNLKDYLFQNGIKIKEIVNFASFDKNAAQNLIDKKKMSQMNKLQ